MPARVGEVSGRTRLPQDRRAVAGMENISFGCVKREEVHLEKKSSKEVSGREEHGPSGRTKNSVPHKLLLFAFSASNAWLLPDDAAGQPEGDGEAEDECCSQRGAKRRGEDGGEENEEEREQPEQETEKERVERRVAWNKPEPCHCEDEPPDQGG